MGFQKTRITKKSQLKVGCSPLPEFQRRQQKKRGWWSCLKFPGPYEQHSSDMSSRKRMLGRRCLWKSAVVVRGVMEELTVEGVVEVEVEVDEAGGKVR